MPSYCHQIELQLAVKSVGNLAQFKFFPRLPHRCPTTSGWVLLRGVPVNPHIILTIDSIHCSPIQLTDQTRSKYGPTLRTSYVVLSVIASRPLRLPYARHTLLAGFTRLDACLTRLEHRIDAGTSGPTSVIYHRMPLALLRVPIWCLCPLLP